MSRGHSGLMIKRKIGNTGGMTDKYEKTRRRNMEKAQLNLDKIFISKFLNINFTHICKRLNLNPIKGRALLLKAEDMHKVKVELDRMIREMYNVDNYKDYDLSKSYVYYEWDKVRKKQIREGKTILLKKDCYDELTDEE